MKVTLDQLSNELRHLAKDTNPRVADIQRDLGVDFLTEVIPATPVDTGLARANWRVGIGVEPTGMLPTSGPQAGAGALATGIATLNAHKDANVTVYIVNTAPHIGALEAGRSQQAPAGFIDAALERAIAKNAGREF